MRYIYAKHEVSGQIGRFTEGQWKKGQLWNSHWTKVRESDNPGEYATEVSGKVKEIEPIEIKDEIEEIILTKNDAPSTQEIKEYFKLKNVKYHPNTGRDKLVDKWLAIKQEEK